MFRASGNEPGWSLLVDGAGLELTTNYGEQRRRANSVTLERVPGGRIYRAQADGTAIVAAVTDRVCIDTMTGMPRPAVVEVTVGEQRLSGCGGDPVALLTGPEWRVTRVEGEVSSPQASSRRMGGGSVLVITCGDEEGRTGGGTSPRLVEVLAPGAVAPQPVCPCARSRSVRGLAPPRTPIVITRSVPGSESRGRWLETCKAPSPPRCQHDPSAAPPRTARPDRAPPRRRSSHDPSAGR